MLSLVCLIALAADPEPQKIEWTLDGVQRTALICLPSKPSEHPPLVFGFHGHGGNMQNAARTFGLHTLWPEAVVVYMQGLPTPGKLDPEGKRNGWQKEVGDQADRDLKFFDEVLATMKQQHRIDERRVYSTGHSNGGGFTYLLWSARPDVFAAMAPSAAGGRSIASLKPLPCLHIAGEQDQTVPFAVQEKVMQAVRRANGCAEESRDWAPGCKLYSSEKGAPFVSFVHPGTHKYPSEAPKLIVKFFQEHQRAEVTQ
jgi:polyhydroxybutyrate depolymerase